MPGPPMICLLHKQEHLIMFAGNTSKDLSLHVRKILPSHDDPLRHHRYVRQSFVEMEALSAW